MRAGGSLFVPVPNTAVELWGLEKGVQIQIEVTPDEMKITPIAKIGGQQIREEDLQHFWETMRDVEVNTWVEDDGNSLRVRFSSPDPGVARALVHNLRRALPAMLAMLGVRSGKER